jgi:uncharacterized protein (TIGR03118 family)
MAMIFAIGMMLMSGGAAVAQTNSYTVTPIVNNTQDSYLINPWGLSRLSNSGLNDNEWWVSDNGTGYTTLYYANKSGSQSLAPLVITIPTANGTGIGSPTGTAYNSGTGPGPGPNNFTFATEDGTISNWNAGQKPLSGSSCSGCHVTTTTIMVNNSSKGASYFGLTLATNATSKKPAYYASNFNGGVEAYDATTFALLTLSGKFTDPSIPAGYKPYGIQTVGSKIWVTFFNGASGGYVDAFDTNGNLKLRLARGSFSAPWGIVQAPASFGAFSNMLLVGNASSGEIGAYSPTTGAFQGFLEDSTGAPIVIPGIWGISFGNGNKDSGPTTTLYYNAGGDQYNIGTFGAITAN